jgi:hypothetical protein
MSDELESALKAIPETRSLVAAELRAMGEASGRYAQFADIDPWIRNIWFAAADLLEDMGSVRPA